MHSLPFVRNCGTYITILVVDVSNGRVDMDIGSKLLGHLGETLVEICSVNNPPRAPETLFQRGNLGVSHKGAVLGTQFEFFDLYQVHTDDLMQALALQENRHIGRYLDTGTNLLFRGY